MLWFAKEKKERKKQVHGDFSFLVFLLVLENGDRLLFLHGVRILGPIVSLDFVIQITSMGNKLSLRRNLLVVCCCCCCCCCLFGVFLLSFGFFFFYYFGYLNILYSQLWILFNVCYHLTDIFLQKLRFASFFFILLFLRGLGCYLLVDLRD